MSHLFIKKLIERNKELLAEALIETEDQTMRGSFANSIRKNLVSILSNRQVFIGGGALIISTFVANILNYIFNAYLGRVLTFNQYALIGLIGGFYSFASIFFGAYSTTVIYRSGFLIGKYGEAAGYSFWKYASKLSLYPSIIITILWIFAIPFMMNFFHTDNIYIFIFFGLILLIGFIGNINQGFLFSKMMFKSLAVISLADPLVKLTATFILVVLGLKEWTFSAIPVSVFAVFTIGWILILKQIKDKKTKAPAKEVKEYSKKFFLISLLSGFSAVAYFTFDIFLAKHFLTQTQAGEYALVSLVGKMVFFLGNLTSPFITPIISRYEGAKKNSLHALYALLGCTALFSSIGFILFGILGHFTVPILYGEKAQIIVPYVLFFTFGMTCYTISGVLVNYYLVRKVYTFIIAPAFLVLLQIILISLFHDSVKTIAEIMSFVLTLNLLVTMGLHLTVKQVKLFEKSFVNFMESLISRYHEIKYI